MEGLAYRGLGNETLTDSERLALTFNIERDNITAHILDVCKSLEHPEDYFDDMSRCIIGQDGEAVYKTHFFLMNEEGFKMVAKHLNNYQVTQLFLSSFEALESGISDPINLHKYL